VRWTRALRTVLAIAALVALAARSGAQDAKPKEDKAKEKDKAAKAKPAARSYSDEDLKKYKDKPTDTGAEGQAGAAGESGETEAVPGQRRSREYGGYQKLPPSTPPAATQEAATADSPPAAEEPASPEEADWKARAQQARAPLQAAEGRIQAIETEIAELRDKLNPMSTKYVLGGNSTAGPGAVLEVEEQIRAKNVELGDARTAAAEAEKSWQTFLEEARAAGVSPAWLKP
jgi:hypothetical protein